MACNTKKSGSYLGLRFKSIRVLNFMATTTVWKQGHSKQGLFYANFKVQTDL